MRDHVHFIIPAHTEFKLGTINPMLIICEPPKVIVFVLRCLYYCNLVTSSKTLLIGGDCCLYHGFIYVVYLCLIGFQK